jgi:hypothetical protein
MKKQHPAALSIILLVLALWSVRSNASDPVSNRLSSRLGSDILYVGDEGTPSLFGKDSSVKSFDVGKHGTQGDFVIGGDGLQGPMGLLIAGGTLIVVNQNVNEPNSTTPINGEVRQYLLRGAKLVDPLVPRKDLLGDPPFAPRGAVLLNGILYVANFTTFPDGQPGAVYAFAGNGKLLGTLTPATTDLKSRFFPRGVVLNPRDGLLYVSSDPGYSPLTGPGDGGQVFKFNPSTLEYVGVFINETGGPGQLNRPEGLVFGPLGNLYITSFRGDPTDADSIRIYDRYGRFCDKILLDQPNQPLSRAFAQALLFGPGGKLFVPISGNGPLTGEIRQYDVRTKEFDVFVPAGILVTPFYLTFGRTNSATLEYGFQSEHERD